MNNMLNQVNTFCDVKIIAIKALKSLFLFLTLRLV